jgi:hypothetical protein
LSLAVVLDFLEIQGFNQSE